ncbi:hypothetical protein [Tichowtungia aerotolerans]|uniref:Uncharacterized protein n=1 Tax=Tichowtungia aerotolerans TaxID=2697043 RepID=A0A6P1MDV4_9BACT|nr:hypothetical protein [Tichowtungia aerotolerans]QHI69275.1 hypothetical protein GT409_07370 [Tichowtungia aerotolerans]
MKMKVTVTVVILFCIGCLIWRYTTHNENSIARVLKILQINDVHGVPENEAFQVNIVDRENISDFYAVFELADGAGEEFIRANGFKSDGYSAFPNRNGWNALPRWWDFDQVPDGPIFNKNNVLVFLRDNELYLYVFGDDEE